MLLLSKASWYLFLKYIYFELFLEWLSYTKATLHILICSPLIVQFVNLYVFFIFIISMYSLAIFYYIKSLFPISMTFISKKKKITDSFTIL